MPRNRADRQTASTLLTCAIATDLYRHRQTYRQIDNAEEQSDTDK